MITTHAELKNKMRILALMLSQSSWPPLLTVTDHILKGRPAVTRGGANPT